MSLRQKVEEVVNKEIVPVLIQDGGSITVVDVDEKEGTVKVKLLGACSGCPLSMITLTVFVEQHLKNRVPGVKRVVLV